MNKKHLLWAVALAVGISACNDGSLPTNPGRDLLGNAGNAPDLGASRYGQVLTEPGLGDPIETQPAVESKPAIPGEAPGYIHESRKETGNYSKYRPFNWQHISDEFNRSEYKPSNYVHITDQHNHSKYKPRDWVHHPGPPNIDNTTYLPPGYTHIGSGNPNESRYHKTIAIPPGM